MKDLGSVDVVVIGGGINGAGIARDAAGRGLSVVLCEKGDLGEGTSSRSGKLIHGGLRYLEYYDFRLVREALIERDVLLRAAPHIVWPMRFVLPHSPEQRPAWLVRLGLFFYDHLGGRKFLPGCATVNLTTDAKGDAIKDEFKLAFEYSDCWVDDARLVVLNAVDAARRGAKILVRTQATQARRVDGNWQVTLRAANGEVSEVRTRVLVNAAGPWVENVISGVVGANAARRVRLVKGSHIIVKKFWQGPHAYVLQNHDKRLIFVNPYENNTALVGTTDIPHEGPPEAVAINQYEIEYLVAAVNRYAKAQLTPADVLHSYSGVRPLYDDNAANPSAVTRDYVFDVQGTPPLLSVFGGKITTFRKLAEHALQKLKPHLPEMGEAWTATAPLPGGDMANGDFAGFLTGLRWRYPWLPDELALHYARRYGTLSAAILEGAESLDDLGQDFGHGLHLAEVNYLKRHEWAQTPDDVLFRRSKWGLQLSAAQRAALSGHF